MHRFALVLMASTQLLMGGNAYASTALVAPFTPRPEIRWKKVTACEETPAPVVSLGLVSKYGDDGPERDEVDPEALDALNQGTEPIRIFMQGVIGSANDFTKRGGLGLALCAMQGLDAWASGNALTDMKNHMAEYKRATTLAGLSFALMQIQPAVVHDSRLPVVQAWLVRLAEATRNYFDHLTMPRASRNNQRYWAGLGVAAAGVVSNRRDLLDWSFSSYKLGVCGATMEGALPLELSRGKKALEYHLHALNALVSLAALLQSNGYPAFEACNGAIHRVVRFTLASIKNPTQIAALADKRQEPFPDHQNFPSPSRLSFIEPYSRFFPGKALYESEILALRPFRQTDLGGNVTLLYESRTGSGD